MWGFWRENGNITHLIVGAVRLLYTFVKTNWRPLQERWILVKFKAWSSELEWPAAKRSYSTSKVSYPLLRRGTPCPRLGAAAALRWSSHEEIPHLQGKRNPSKTINTERGHQRADRLKPQSQKTSQSDHMDHSLVELNETKPRRAGPPKTDASWWRGLTECGPLGKGIANHFSILALRSPWTVWKGKKIGHWKTNSPGR